MLLRHIEPQNGGSRFLLRFDGAELLCGPQEILDFRLEPDMELDPLSYEKLRDACALFAVRMKAAALISARAMSSGELVRKLTEKGASREHAEAAASRLAELGILNDAEYARSIVRHCAAKGYGPRRAEQELYRRLIPRALWAEALSGLPRGTDTLDSLIDKKLRGRPLEKEDMRSLSSFLLRKGYDWNEIRDALSRRGSDPYDEQDPEPV